jgi:hypothetical protein
MCVDYCDWSTRDNNGVAKVLVLLWRYTYLRKVITSDVGVRLRSGAAQRRQP